MDYFKHFGSEWFTLPTGESILMTDLTKRASLIGSIPEGSLLTYTIKDGETPESIAYRLYGNSSYWWLVLMVAGKYEQSDWETLDSLMEEEAQRYYPHTDINQIKHYLDTTTRFETYHTLIYPAPRHPSAHDCRDLRRNPQSALVSFL